MYILKRKIILVVNGIKISKFENFKIYLYKSIEDENKAIFAIQDISILDQINSDGTLIAPNNTTSIGHCLYEWRPMERNLRHNV